MVVYQIQTFDADDEPVVIKGALSRQLTSVTCSTDSDVSRSSATDSDDEDDLITSDSDEKQRVVDERFEVLDNPEVAAKLQEFYKSINYRDFFCKFDPWLIVPSGSFIDLFNWVPESQRIGPWTMTAKVYFSCILFFTAILGTYIFGTSASPISTMYAEIEALEYPKLFSGWWCYNVIALSWMCYIIHNIIYHTPVSGFAWVTYTVQSWTFLTIRHALCVIAPFSRTAVYVAEFLRFPCAIQPALTFTVWNFIIFPIAYFVVMKTEQHKMIFYKVSTCFPMMNLHVLNIVLCVANVVYSSPARRLNMVDFYIAFVMMVLYMAWYFLILDRIGFHLYKDYSPRSHPFIILTTWTATIAAYIGWFVVIREILMPENNDVAQNTSMNIFVKQEL